VIHKTPRHEELATHAEQAWEEYPGKILQAYDRSARMLSTFHTYSNGDLCDKKAPGTPINPQSPIFPTPTSRVYFVQNTELTAPGLHAENKSSTDEMLTDQFHRYREHKSWFPDFHQ